MMKQPAFWMAVLMASLCAARAQVEVQVVMDQTEFLAAEAVPVAVRVINHSGQTLHFGPEDWLSFSVEAQDGLIVVKSGDPPTDHNFDLESSGVATQHANVEPYFTITQTGHYTVVATVKLKDWDQEVTSPPKGFDVIQGVKLSEQEFGVPDSSATNHSAPEVRKYILQEATYLKHLRLYLRLTDPDESRVFRVLAIGPMTSFSQPVTQLDQQNNLHLLYEESARTYLYVVTNPDGQITMRQMYYYTDAAPRMKTDDSGGIYIAGGTRHVSPDDVPAPVPAPPLTELAPTNR
jgi:hypothetical protein